MRKNLSKNLKSLGNIGEDLASEYLQKQGYRILDRNVFLYHGEIDLIALQNKETVFVEVKTRTSDMFGFPSEAVTAKKLHVLIRTAELYLQNHPNLPQQFRIDVVSLIVGKDNSVISFVHDKSVTDEWY
jgi:putative endonuclease